jgi:hypothetical protein
MPKRQPVAYLFGLVFMGVLSRLVLRLVNRVGEQGVYRAANAALPATLPTCIQVRTVESESHTRVVPLYRLGQLCSSKIEPAGVGEK